MVQVVIFNHSGFNELRCEKNGFLRMRKQRRREADQSLCFRYIDSTIPLLPKYKNFKLLAILCGCTAQFVSDLVGNPKDRFSHNEAQITHFCLVKISMLGNKHKDL